MPKGIYKRKVRTKKRAKLGHPKRDPYQDTPVEAAAPSASASNEVEALREPP
jgi:hypothetical protein